ncbi:hypothetical protein LU674_001720 [Pseudomonas alloputida]|uniref:Uncharacterized protein n=1 Tax=Pseudomonas alloputida TaxID=1940621 RepID=A0AAW7HE23_9PSED|nr:MULTISPECIES: hypothetical protein [Pseudomonas]MDM3951070.1 hypothetical protein [Pseudomonas alloputida]
MANWIEQEKDMSRSVGAVDFEDGRRLYLIYDGTVGVAWRPLFETSDAAWDWYCAESVEFAEPVGAASTELPVVLTIDLHYDDQERWKFASRASADAMWLTGPASSDEAADERSKHFDEPFGGYFSDDEKPVN